MLGWKTYIRDNFPPKKKLCLCWLSIFFFYQIAIELGAELCFFPPLLSNNIYIYNLQKINPHLILLMVYYCYYDEFLKQKHGVNSTQIFLSY